MRSPGRPRKSVLEAKKPVTFSLEPVNLVILDNLADATNQNRSQVINGLIKAAGFNELGLSALEKHLATPGPIRARRGGKWVETESVACNPYGIHGECPHSACQAAYRKERV